MPNSRPFRIFFGGRGKVGWKVQIGILSPGHDGDTFHTEPGIDQMLENLFITFVLFIDLLQLQSIVQGDLKLVHD